MTSSTTVAHPGPRRAPGAGCTAGRRRGVGRALSYLLTTVLASVFTAARPAGLVRRPGPVRPADEVMLEVGEAALEQLAAAPSPGSVSLRCCSCRRPASRSRSSTAATRSPADFGPVAVVLGRETGYDVAPVRTRGRRC